MLFNGPTGVGKSVIIQNCLREKAHDLNMILVTIQFSAQTSSARTQEMIEAKLKSKKKNILGAPQGKTVLVPSSPRASAGPLLHNGWVGAAGSHGPVRCDVLVASGGGGDGGPRIFAISQFFAIFRNFRHFPFACPPRVLVGAPCVPCAEQGGPDFFFVKDRL